MCSVHQPVESVKDVAHEVGIDPANGAVIDIGDLEQRIHIGLSGSSLAEDHHAHLPIAFVRLSGHVVVLDDHELTRPHAQEDGVWGISVWCCHASEVVNAHVLSASTDVLFTDLSFDKCLPFE